MIADLVVIIIQIQEKLIPLKYVNVIYSVYNSKIEKVQFCPKN